MAAKIIFALARVVSAALLLWALAKHPIGYYTTLRLITCTVCAYGTYLAAKWKQTGWAFTFGAIAILFQPFIAFRMTRQTWTYVDVTTAIVLLISIPWLWNAGKE